MVKKASDWLRGTQVWKSVFRHGPPTTARMPDLRICEHLPQIADVSDRFAVVRTMTHSQNDHYAAHYIQTGHPMPIAPRGAAGVDATEKDWPAMGSVI